MRFWIATVLFCLSCSEYVFQDKGDGSPGLDTGTERTSDSDADTDTDTDTDTDGSPDLDTFEEVFELSTDLEVNRIDVAFLLDTTCSMYGTADTMASEYSSIVADLDLTVSDAAYGFATFDDYNFTALGTILGTGDDRPFMLQQQMTTDRELVQVALESVCCHNGGDGPESAMEGLYQGLSGVGYDQDDNGVYDAATDVLPFISDATDSFGGTASSTVDLSTTGGGTLGGYGFRDGSLPVIVYATDNFMRDADDPTYDTPPSAAGASDVVDEANAHGARLIGISTHETQLPVPQMQELAYATDSLYAADGDGIVDDPLVLIWTEASPAFRSTVVDAIRGMLESVTFATVTAEVEGNIWGFDTDIAPASYSDVTVGSTAVSLSFTVTLSGEVPASTEDQTYPLVLNIYGDGTTLLGSQDVTVLVPASL